jgi:hypothetical protein
MTKSKIGEYSSEINASVERLLLLEKTLVKNIDWFHKNKPELIKASDFRPGTFSRMLSSTISARFSLDRMNEFILDPNWEGLFIDKYVPEPWKSSKYSRHIKGIDMSIRFYLFHSFYHQLETTIRIICTALELGDNGKPINRVNKITNIFPSEFILFIDAIRNSIHNNGYYIPLIKQANEFEYEISDFIFKFYKNDKVDLGTKEILIIIEELIKYTIDLIHHKKIEKMPVILDKD